jgi:hypothetical protein
LPTLSITSLFVDGPVRSVFCIESLVGTLAAPLKTKVEQPFEPGQVSHLISTTSPRPLPLTCTLVHLVTLLCMLVHMYEPFRHHIFLHGMANRDSGAVCHSLSMALSHCHSGPRLRWVFFQPEILGTVDRLALLPTELLTVLSQLRPLPFRLRFAPWVGNSGKTPHPHASGLLGRWCQISLQNSLGSGRMVRKGAPG